MFVAVLYKYVMTYEFKNNKYYACYVRIINNAQSNQRKKGTDAYYERHHILPRSLGGSNHKINLVLLTAREHLIAHLLLVRMVQNCDVYKMVNAVRRFKQGIKNSRHFESIRRTISRFSTGNLNPSHGKAWIHNIVTKQILYIHLSEFNTLDNAIFKKGLPHQRGGFSKGRIWLNNGVEEVLIEPDSAQEYLLHSWILGRSSITPVAHLKLMAAKRHTKDKDLEHSKKMSGINHFNYGKPAFTKGRTWMNDGAKSKMIESSLVSVYINQGWSTGRLPK